MKIQYLNINEYKYRVEYIPYEECIIANEYEEKSFVMIRNFSLMNNIVCDDNIYFIERTLFNRYKDCLINKTENNEIVFPSNLDTMYYSTNYHIFNDTYIDNDLINEVGVYDILMKHQKDDSSYEFTADPIPCDLIKIYHPGVKTNQQLIIHIENVINNIHFHYLCNTYNWFRKNNKYNSKSEHHFENNVYSEYITCYIPSIRQLFDRIIVDKDTYDYNWYFKENLNIVDDISDKNANFISNTIINTTDENGDIIDQYVPLTLFTQPCVIEEYNEDYNNNEVIEPEEKIFKKVYFKYHYSIDNNYITTPLNISLYPYESINKTTNIYTLLDNYLPATTSILYEYKFSLLSTIDFDNDGNMALLGYFDYPLKKEYFEKVYSNTNSALTEAYCFYHHIINRNNVYIADLKNAYIEELDEINSITDIDKETIDLLIKTGTAIKNPTLSAEYPTVKDYYIAKLKESRWQVFLEEYIDQFKATIDFFGFRIELASDKNFKHIILSKNISLLDLKSNEDLISDLINNDNYNEYIDSFQHLGNGLYFFNLKGIFTDWKQMPDIIVARLTFIDRFIGNEIKSNEVFISKEKFKYITNNDKFNRVNQLVDLNNKILNLNNDMIELNLNDGANEFNQIISQLENENIKNDLVAWCNKYYNNKQYSFINKVNCIIKNDSNVNEQISSSNKNTQIIYKPIFFKTNKLNNITLKYMQNQNIGIDLHEYMSKVDLFIMTLGGNTYYEVGRNSNYVLFNISTTTITDNSGSFEIYNNDHEYITYGTWSIIR